VINVGFKELDDFGFSTGLDLALFKKNKVKLGFLDG
jgi:hypothetical protein